MKIELREQICELIDEGTRPVSFGEITSGRSASYVTDRGVPLPQRHRRLWRHPRLWQPSRLAIGVGLTAAVAAGAVAAATVFSAAPGAGPFTAAGGHSSARHILLTAANAAARRPEGSGTYWHVRTWEGPGGGLTESWTRRDGQTWIRGPYTHKIRKIPRYVDGEQVMGPFFLDGMNRHFRDIQGLPTQPAALKEWIVTNAREHGSKHGGPTSDPRLIQQAIFGSLTSLVSQLPAPPKVRAAAFRVLASLPHVKSVGRVKGGEALQFTLWSGWQHITLVVDPSTGLVHNTNFFVQSDGAEVFSHTNDMTITAQWTNTLPRN